LGDGLAGKADGERKCSAGLQERFHRDISHCRGRSPATARTLEET
jgi:hypothetical protein